MPQQLGALAVGTKIKDTSTSYYGIPIIWKIADKNHSGYPADSVTLITENILTLKCFDAKESSNSNADNRICGNNRYIYSNIRKWLNSDAGSGKWYTAQHSSDAPPIVVNTNGYNPYDTQAGFLNAFSTNFRNALLTTTLTVAKNTVTDGGNSETLTDKIFLASNTEVGLANENSILEGEKLALFSDNVSRAVRPTAQAISNSTFTNESLKVYATWYWWLRTPYAAYSCRARVIHSDGTLNGNGYACNGDVGVRPLCNLLSSILVSDNTDADGCYNIVWDRPPSISGVDGNLGVKNDTFEYIYTVTDPEGNATTVQEMVDGKLIKSYTAELGKEIAMKVEGVNWLKLSQGSHNLTVTATDTLGRTVTRSMTFTKQINSLFATLETPLPATAQPKRINVLINAQVPAGALLLVEVCNNANDPNPAWEDATEAALTHHAHIFSNTIKTNKEWGVNIKVTIKRKNAIGDCYITGIGGNFE